MMKTVCLLAFMTLSLVNDVVFCSACNCFAVYDPVCGINGVTYSNECVARCANMQIAHNGACGSSCITVESKESESCINCDIGAVCPAFYEMTGCSSKSEFNNNHLLYGSRIIKNEFGIDTCIAENGGIKVKSYARCCKFDAISQCYSVSSTKSDKNDDSLASVTCNNGGVLTDCSYYSELYDASNNNGNKVSHPLDGGYSGNNNYYNSNNDLYTLHSTDNKCNAQNGDFNGLYGVFAQARCCNLVSNKNLECKTIWGAKSDNNDNSKSTVRCLFNDEWKMTGCNGYTKWAMIDGSFIEIIEGIDTCVTQNSKAGEGVWSVATCCKQNDLSIHFG